MKLYQEAIRLAYLANGICLGGPFAYRATRGKKGDFNYHAMQGSMDTNSFVSFIRRRISPFLADWVQSVIPTLRIDEGRVIFTHNHLGTTDTTNALRVIELAFVWLRMVNAMVTYSINHRNNTIEPGEGGNSTSFESFREPPTQLSRLGGLYEHLQRTIRS